MQEPDDEIDPSDLEAIHKDAAEMVVEDVSAAHDDDEDFDDEFDVAEDEDTELSANAASSEGQKAEGAEVSDEPNPGGEPAKGA